MAKARKPHKKPKGGKAANDEWPYLQAAFFCERLLEEKSDMPQAPGRADVVNTAVRIVDHIRLPAELPMPEKGTGIALPLTMVIGFKAGDAIGERQLEISLTPPSGTSHKLLTQDVRFLGGEVGALIHAKATPLRFEGLGLYWYTVRLRSSAGSRVYTKMPLRLSVQPTQEKAAEEGKKKAR